MRGTSDVIGNVELATALALIAGAFNSLASALGAAISSLPYMNTLTFFLRTPGVAEHRAGGFPAISALGQFPLKRSDSYRALVNFLERRCHRCEGLC